ncbi:MAG: PCRF domain-containing protein, partial [Candidatus Saccharimonadales bacterium]
MDEQAKHAAQLKSQIEEALEHLRINQLDKELSNLRADSQKPDFWDDSTRAQDVMRQIAKLEARVTPWLELRKSIDEISELVKLDDDSLQNELKQQLEEASKKFAALKEELKFNGPYDDHEAIVSIYAGAGGTDAQDWTQMLLRMYSRYFEKNRWKVVTVDESAGDEAGLKSITLEVAGPFAYGTLKG